MIKRGKVINIKKNKVYVLTDEKEFTVLKKNTEPPIIGEIYSGEVYNLKVRIKPLIFLFIVALCVFGMSRVIQSSVSDLSMIIQMNSTFKVYINKYDKVVKIESLDPETEMIAELIPIEGKPIDEALILLYNACKAHDLITDEFKNGLTPIRVLVSNNRDSRSIDFQKFEDYIKSQNIKIEINLDGTGNI